MIRKHLSLLFVVFLGSITPGLPGVQLPGIFSDNMVLQQGQPIQVWGWADDGEVVTVRFRNQKVTTTAANRHWRVTLKPVKPAAPEMLTVSTPNQDLVMTNVLVGEVWVCSGQSNMEWPMKSSHQPAADIASATNTQIRLLKVPKTRLPAATVLLNARWEVLSPESVESFSAVGYYFGRDLQAARRVPVGLIGTYWGGTPAESWTSREGLEISPRLCREILEPHAAAMKKFQEAQQQFEQRRAEAAREGKPFNAQAPRQPWAGAELYNGMIAPLVPFAIKGAIWYQGEANAGRAEQYRTLFADMIRSWRHSWGQPDLPFLCVQLAPFKAIQENPAESDWAELREAQLLATQILPKVGMAVITDVGDEKDIHPRKKEPVGARLALAARAIAYGEKITYAGPAYKKLVIQDNQAVVHFDHVGQGLEARGGELKGFAICGADRRWVWAKARINGHTVVVTSDQVSAPVAVRFGWADCPVVNLWNRDGLPASPFRTDDFPLITAPK